MKEKHPITPSSVDHRRLTIVALVIFSLFSLLIAQFYFIQVIEGEKWSQQAQKQHFFVIKEPFQRGTFYSNPYVKQGHPSQPQPFAIDVPKYHLYADPQSIPLELRNEISEHLVAHLNLSIEERLNLRQQLDRKSRKRKLAMWLDKEHHQLIQSWWLAYAKKHKVARNALFFVKDYQRSYPFGKLLGQVLHSIQNCKEESTDRALPTGGLELYFDSYLQGKGGKRRLLRSPYHSFETGEVISYPEHGADIYLTINHYLQAIMEEELEKGVKKCKAKAGWAAMMDPRTGEIWALAQYPSFAPSDYQKYFNDPALIEHTKVKAITDANEPGSVFKPFTVVLALKANQELQARGEPPIFTTDEKIATSNGRFPGRSKPITDTSLHYFLNLDMGMQKSSNIYMARLAERMIKRLGNDWYRRQLQQIFGIGEKTHIELPAESAGVLPKPGKLHPNGTLEWTIATPFSLAFGHNVQVTTVQLLRAYAVFANGGYLVQPTLVRKIVKKDAQGNEHIILDNTSPERIARFPSVLEKSILERVIESMQYVTKPGGTAWRGDVPGYSELGKTSTAKKIVNGTYSETTYFANFTGIVPATQPCFVLCVAMDEPEYGYVPGLGKVHNGGNCTASAFREIARRSLEYLGVPSDDPYGYPAGDPRRNLDKAYWMAETRKLKEIYDTWNKGKS